MLWAVFIAVLVLLDQIMKVYIRNNYPLNQQNEIIQGFFHITHVENTGAAFGILKNARVFFIVVTVIVIAILIILMIKNHSKMLRLSLSFIAAGALGNWIDRVFRGTVTDFFDFKIFNYDYPVFNIADICINVGCVLLFIFILFFDKDQKQADKGETEDTADGGGT